MGSLVGAWVALLVSISVRKLSWLAGCKAGIILSFSLKRSIARMYGRKNVWAN